MKKKVLIFPAGAENALEIYDALKYNVNVDVYGASGKKDFAEYKFPKEKYIEGNFYINTLEFKTDFQKLLEQYNIDIVIPTHDEIALYFAENRDAFSAQILISDARTARICREKKLMYEIVKDMDFCPTVYKNIEDIADDEFPVFMKPNKGAGAVGAKCVYDKKTLEEVNDLDSYVVTEFLPGEELSVDCFTNRKNELTFVGARSRDRIQMGIAFRSTTVETTPEIYEIAKTINERLRFLGAWYFQIRKDQDGKYKLLEISCRQAGTMTLYRHMGINFPMLGIFELLGVDTSYVLNEGSCQVERCLNSKFKYNYEYKKVYIDFDDTIIVNNQVCDVLIRFIYQCINKGIKLILLTRHDKDLSETMKKHRLSESLFDEIHHFDFSKKKIEFIQPEKAIFIDNSFAERREVFETYQIPVFDVDMVDMLIES